MTKAAVFTMKLEPELRAAFLEAAEAAHRPASQIVRELMRTYVSRQQEERDRHAFLARKVERARASLASGQGRAHDAVEAAFAMRRASALDEG